MLFFGKDIIHTRDTEDRPAVGCPACEGITIDGDGFPIVAAVARGHKDPLPLAETMVFVCKCGRSHYRHLPGTKTEGNDEIAAAYGRDLTATDPEKVSSHKFIPRGKSKGNLKAKGDPPR